MVYIHLSLLLAILFVMFTSALPEPHHGMINNDDMRDVGVVYTAFNFTGTKKFIFETKKAASCLPLFNDVVSIKICKTDIACTFFTGNSCVAGPDNFAVRIGCGDVSNVTTPHGDYFKYYRCGAGESRNVPDMEIVTKHHEKDDDENEM